MSSSRIGATWAEAVTAPVKSKRTLGYFRANAASELYEYILEKFLAHQKRTNITKAQFAASIQKDAGQLNRLLAGPGNWTIETVSDLLLGMGERLNPDSVPIVVEATKETTLLKEAIAAKPLESLPASKAQDNVIPFLSRAPLPDPQQQGKSAQNVLETPKRSAAL